MHVQEQAQLKQTRSLDFYRSVVANSMDLVSVVNEQGNYLFVGDSVKLILGYEPEELLGTNAYSFIHPDDVSGLATAMEDILDKGQALVPAFRFRSKTGDWRWIECTATNMLHNQHVQGIMTSSRDVTAAVRLAYEKEHHQAHYESLFFEHPDAVFNLSPAGYFQQVNQHLKTVSGYTEQEMQAAVYGNLVHPRSKNIADKAFEKALQGIAHTVELSILTKGGIEKEVAVSLMPVYLRDKLQGVQGIAKDITETNRSQKLIQEQAQQLNNIIESISEPFYVLDSAWRFTFVSAAFASFMCLNRNEITGKNIWELFPELKSTKFYKISHEVVINKASVHFEETYTQPHPCTLYFTLYPNSDGVAVHFIDITSQKSTEREIEKLSFVASKTINGVVIMDPECRIEWVNDGFCRLTGYSREEVLGLVPSDILQGAETDPAAAARIRSKYKTLKPFSEEVLNYKKCGEKLWFYLDVTPIFDQFGNLVNYIALETDITEKKEAEAKLLKLADDLYKQNRDLQQFTYIISHNLRAPVANALGLAQLVGRLPKDAEPYDVALEKLHISIHELDSVIKDINNVLSIRDSGRSTQREVVYLQELCEEVLEQFREKLQHSHAQVKLEVDPDYKLLSIRAYLYNILYNLISNAIKFKSEERSLEVLIKAERDKRGYVLKVSDNGSGLNMRLVEHQLFQLYKRFHPNTHGKGIGLFLVKTQVEALGGKIKAKSAPDQGTTFTILFGSKYETVT